MRPDGIIGHTPHGNGLGFARGLGLFLSMFASIYGEGAEVVFPGGVGVWKARRSHSSQDILAKFHVYASLNPERTAERAFNIADKEVTTWEQIWPGISATLA